MGSKVEGLGVRAARGPAPACPRVGLASRFSRAPLIISQPLPGLWMERRSVHGRCGGCWYSEPGLSVPMTPSLNMNSRYRQLAYNLN